MEDNAIEVFYVKLDKDEKVVSGMTEILASDEIIRATSYRFRDDKRRYVLTRGALRILLSEYLGTNPKNVMISYAEQGKPILEQPHAGLHFNVSHSRDMVLIAVSRSNPVGIDIEFVNDRIDPFDIAKRVFPAEENKMLRSEKTASVMTAFYNLWTRREAFVKAVGDGISQIKWRDCSLVGDDAFSIPMTISYSGLGDAYSLVSLPVNEHYRAGLATRGLMGSVLPRYSIWELRPAIVLDNH